MKRIALFSIILFVAHSLNAQMNSTVAADAIKNAKTIPGNALYGDINFGYSNYGMMGDADAYYRVKNKFVSAGYYKSHLCYSGDYDGIPFPKAGPCTNHITIISYSVSGGIILPGKLCPSISCGISASQFTYVHSMPVRNDFGLEDFWHMAVGGDYDDGVISTSSKIVIGVPLAFKVHLAQRHFVGLDAGLKVDINTEKVFTAATLGIRFGKVVKK